MHHHQIEAEIIPQSFSAILLISAIPIDNIPGFKEGLFFIQDASAQFAAELMNLEKGQIILDACAAPGGKATHILEKTENQCTLVAVDNDGERVKKIHKILYASS